LLSLHTKDVLLEKDWKAVEKQNQHFVNAKRAIKSGIGEIGGDHGGAAYDLPRCLPHDACLTF